MWTNPSLIQTDVDDIKSIVMQAFTYTDPQGQMRAASFLGMASEKMWKEAANNFKKKFGKEIQAAAEGLSKWGAAVSDAAIRDAISKVLINAECYPYPPIVTHLVESLSKNPYWTRHLVPGEDTATDTPLGAEDRK